MLDKDHIMIAGGFYSSTEYFSLSSQEWIYGPDVSHSDSEGGVMKKIEGKVYLLGRTGKIYQLKEEVQEDVVHLQLVLL